MTTAAGTVGPGGASHGRSLQALVALSLERMGAKVEGPQGIELVRTEELAGERPRILDVVAACSGELFHVVVGLRSPGDEVHFLVEGDDPVLGLYEDAAGLGVAVDALMDADLACGVLRAVAPGEAGEPLHARLMSADEDEVLLGFDERVTLRVFRRVYPGRHPAVDLLVRLDEAGFNHIAPPLAIWRFEGGDLGVVQEQLAGASPGRAVAEVSLRDLFDARCDPSEAGGDFAPEAHAIGTMTARMHLALDRAYGRRRGEPAAWADQVEEMVRAADPALLESDEVAMTLSDLRSLESGCTSLVVHGDFHLDRVCRNDHGWYLWELRPPPVEESRRFASPLADVASMLWSLGSLAKTIALEHDPEGETGLEGLARAWERRNRRAFLAGYLNVPGIHGLVPHDRQTLKTITAALELGRAARERLAGTMAPGLAGEEAST
jgi:predicted trehalose synthase